MGRSGHRAEDGGAEPQEEGAAGGRGEEAGEGGRRCVRPREAEVPPGVSGVRAGLWGGHLFRRTLLV